MSSREPDDDAVRTNRFSFTSALWEHEGSSAWFFVNLPEPEADDIEQFFGHRAAGFGWIRVEVTVGSTRWRTSIFPDSKRKTYVLPVKKAVRVAEGLEAGSAVQVALTVVE